MHLLFLSDVLAFSYLQISIKDPAKEVLAALMSAIEGEEIPQAAKR